MILSSRPPRRSGIVRRAIAKAKPSRIASTTKASSRLFPSGRWSRLLFMRGSDSPSVARETSKFVAPKPISDVAQAAAAAVGDCRCRARRRSEPPFPPAQPPAVHLLLQLVERAREMPLDPAGAEAGPVGDLFVGEIVTA